MELEAIRMCATAAADAVIGINAMLAAMQIAPGDARPGPITIYNAVDDPWVARRLVAEKDPGIEFPAVAVLLSAPMVLREVMTSNRDAECTVLFAYIARDMNAVKTTRDALYTNHAIARFLRRFNDPSNGAFRQSNGIQLLNPLKTDQGLMAQSWEKAIAVAGTTATWLLRDTAG